MDACALMEGPGGTKRILGCATMDVGHWNGGMSMAFEKQATREVQRAPICCSRARDKRTSGARKHDDGDNGDETDEHGRVHQKSE